MKINMKKESVAADDTTEEKQLPSDDNGKENNQSSNNPPESAINSSERSSMSQESRNSITPSENSALEAAAQAVRRVSSQSNDTAMAVASAKVSSTSTPKSTRKRASLASIDENTGSGSAVSHRRSSLEMRRMPVNVLLKPANLCETTSVLSEDFGQDEGLSNKKKEDDSKQGIDILRCLCLRPNYTLRKQMMLSFGTVNLITITVVVLVCVALTLSAGQSVESASTETMKALAKESIGHRSRFLAEWMTEDIILTDAVKFLYEATRDRFEGHPNPSDDEVPFFDVESASNVYPMTGPTMPMEWNVSANVDETNYEEFLQSRWKIYQDTPVDTRQAGFIIQGACDPEERDPSSGTYWPNCTASNNDIRTGGVISPSNQTELYYRKAADMVPMLRSLFEEWEVIRDLGLYFLNQGAGASINYPQYPASTHSTYMSIGCEWLLLPNPLDPSKSIGTEDMLKNCRPSGERVSSRLYNPIERPFCREQALNPDKIFIQAYENAWDPGEWLLFLGRGVYDRSTDEFVACMYIGINLEKMTSLLEEYSTSERVETTVVHYEEDGHVVTSSKNFTQEGRIKVSEADIGFSNETFKQLFELVDYDSMWDPEEVRATYANYTTDDDRFYVSVYPIPAIPDEYDSDYVPVFFVVTSYEAELLFETFTSLNDNVERAVNNIITFAWACGLAGLILAFAVIATMARMLTAPLTAMDAVTKEIVGSFGDASKEDEIRQSGDISMDRNCSPKTELRDVVTEFNIMVSNFSGASEAKSERFRDNEMQNSFPARGDLFKLYESRNDQLFKYNATGECVDDDWIEKESRRSSGVVSMDSISYLHFGPNFLSSTTTIPTPVPTDRSIDSSAKPKRCSSLFVWIVVLIATPLLFITILVSAGVMTKINNEFDQSTADIEEEYLGLQQDNMLAYARRRAGFVASFTERSTNDLYMLTRLSSWLMFGAVNTAGAFTEISSGLEECKEYADDFDKCPYVQNNFVCDCAWNERGYEDLCSEFPRESTSRRLQTKFWLSEMTNTSDGDRSFTTYPAAHFSPESGFWFDEQSMVPGVEIGLSIPSYSTMYDRIRTSAAVPVMHPLYHYGLGEGKETTLTLGIGFEADGTWVSYEGCHSSLFASLSSWSSKMENGAPQLRPELCPLGKYGYDPR